MKRLEKRERENLVRIFYTIIKVSSSFPLSSIKGHCWLNIRQVALPDTPRLAFSVDVIRRDDTYVTLIVSATISIGNYYGNYEVHGFKSAEGLKSIREVTKVLKHEAD